MDSITAEKFLIDQVPVKHRSLIPATLKTAYKQARIIAQNEPILEIESAKDNHGRLISWAVDFGFKKLIETGQLPFDYRWNSFKRPTGRYLEIILSHSVCTISQVSDPTKQPRNVGFRENARLNNSPYFKEFYDLDGFEDESAICGVPHFLLIHGHGELNFAHLGVPHSIHRQGYIYKTPNLMQQPHIISNDLVPIENTDTDFDAAMTLKQEIDKWRKDNGDK